MAFNGIQTHALVSTYGIYKPEIRRLLTKKYPRPSALNWLRALGRVSKRPRKSTQMSYTFYEEGNYFNSTATIESQAINGGDASFVDLTLEEVDHHNGGTGSYPVVGDLVIFTNEVVGYVTAINRTVNDAHVVTVAPIVATGGDVNAAAVNFEKISFFSGAEGERSDAPESRVPQVASFSNQMHIIRESYEVTDIESVSETWFDIDGQPHLWIKGMDEAAQRFEMKEQLALLVSKQSDGTAVDPDTGNKIFTTDGLIPDLRTNGTNVQYADPINLAKWDEITTTLDSVYGDREYMLGCGLPFYQKIQDFMNTLGDAGDKGVNFDVFDGGKEQALSLNLKAFHYVGYNFFFDKWDVLTHADSLGATGMPFPDLAVGMPMGDVANPVSSDGTAEFEPAIQVTFFESPLGGKQNGGEFSVWEDGAGARPIPTNDIATRRINHYMIKGLEVRNKDKFLLLHL